MALQLVLVGIKTGILEFDQTEVVELARKADALHFDISNKADSKLLSLLRRIS